MLGFFTRLITPSFAIVDAVTWIGGNLLLIAGIFYFSFTMFEQELNYQFSFNTFLKKGLLIGGLIGIINALAVILQIQVFGNETLEMNLFQIRLNIGKNTPAEIAEAEERAEMFCSWYLLSAKQILRNLFFGAVYSVIISALMYMHPNRVKTKKA